MAPELRPRRSKAADAAPAEETPKSKSKTSKGPAKRKADEDVSPAATKKQKAVKTTSKAATSKDSEPTSKTKKAKTPVKAKDTEETADTTSSKASKKGKTADKAKEGQGKDLKVNEKTPASTSNKAATSAKAKSTQKTEKTDENKQKKGKASSEATTKTAPKQTKETPNTATGKKAPQKASKSAKKSEKKAEPAVAEEEEEEEEGAVSAQDDEQASSDEDEVDEQTKALVETIDSGDDDEPGAGVVLFEEGQSVGKIPEMTKKEKKAAKKALAAAKEKEESGVIYVGRLPHGFYEHEMKSYFSQFGPIRNLRLSRNKKTGRAKHFAFVEFEELSTAEIVAKTMDNYLLFGHILKCSVIPKAQVHDDLFKGGNKRFKPVPWNKMEGKQMERPLLEDKWTRKINKEKKRRADRAKKLEAIGYDFAAPELMNVDAVPAIAPSAAEASTETPVKAIESATAAETVEGENEQEATPKTAKRGRGRPSKTPQKAGKADTPKKAKN